MYTQEEKLRILKFADKAGVPAAAKEYGMSAVSIRRWKQAIDSGVVKTDNSVKEEDLGTPFEISYDVPPQRLYAPSKLDMRTLDGLNRLSKPQAGKVEPSFLIPTADLKEAEVSAASYGTRIRNLVVKHFNPKEFAVRIGVEKNFRKEVLGIRVWRIA